MRTLPAPMRHALAVVLLIGLAPACDRSDDRMEDTPAATVEPTGTPSPEPAPKYPAPSGPARITFAALSHDFGRIHEADQAQASFGFTNTGGETLVIREVKATCGCTTPRLSKQQYAPGESGSIQVLFDPPGNGPQKKYISVLTNTRPELTQLTITANVAPFLVFEPKWLQLGVLPYGVEQRPTVVVRSPDGPVEIERVTTTSPDATARVVPMDEAMRYPVTLPADAHLIEVHVPADAAWGGLYFGLSVTAKGVRASDGKPVSHTSSIRVAGQLFGKLTADPDMFRFGCDPGETFERKVLLERTDGKPFEILTASVSSRELPNATVRTERLRPNAWEVTMTATGTMAGLRCGGDVTVLTDVPGEERLDLGILGMVRAKPLPGR